MKTFLTIILTAALAIIGTWFFTQRSANSPTAERKPLYYQSAMHPWIKSDKPGRCTICGMELTPVYAGEKGFDAKGKSSTVALSQSQIQVIHVQTEEAKIQPLTRTLKVAGVIDDDERRHRILSAYTDGRVDKLYANHHGVEVIAGEPLALIYSPALLQAEREYRQLSGDLKRNTALRLLQMGLTNEQIQALPEKPDTELSSQIIAPLSGTVVAHDVYEGQYVTTGQKMFEIADFSIMWFMMDVYEQDLPWIELGQEVKVTTPSKPGKIFVGKITFIDPNFNEATRSTQVRVELANPLVNGRRELLHKLYADGEVLIKIPSTLAVPRSAVIQTSSQALVYIDQEGGAYAQTIVTLGQRGDKLVEILSGLRAGDQVVTNGNLLIDGQAEMNRAFQSPAPATELVTMTVELSEAQKLAIADFIRLADAMSGALGVDDVAAFNKASESAMMRTADFIEAIASLPTHKEDIDALSKSRHFHGFQDLPSARKAFHPFSLAAAAVIESIRKLKDFPEVKIWECPMVDQAIPNAPKKGRWLQNSTRPGANPFFGVEMSDCGKEIKS